MFAARPGQKSPTALHNNSSSSSSTDSDKDREENINYTTVDWREFMCNTWHLEPTLRSVTASILTPVAVIWQYMLVMSTAVGRSPVLDESGA